MNASIAAYDIWNRIDIETSGPTVLSTVRSSRNTARRSVAPRFGSGCLGTRNQIIAPVNIGAQASQRYGVLQAPVAWTRNEAVSGTAKKLRWPPVMWKPIAAPRLFGGKARASSAAAGAWYEPAISPITTSSTSRCQYSVAKATAALMRPVRISPQMITGRDPTLSARTPIGALESPRLRLKAERSEEHTSELQSRQYLVCRLLLEKK